MYSFASNTNAWFDPLGLKKKRNKKPKGIIPYDDIIDDVDKWSLVPVSQRQKCLIKDKLPSAKQRSVRQNSMIRRDFSRRQKHQIRDWGRETGHTLPAGDTPHHIFPLFKYMVESNFCQTPPYWSYTRYWVCPTKTFAI